MDDELKEEVAKLKSNNSTINEKLEEHLFIANCLKMGLRMEDLKELDYKDVMKIMICYNDSYPQQKKNQSRKATQADWDKLAGRR